MNSARAIGVIHRDGWMTLPSLDRQLANDDPKCANCKSWRQVIQWPHIGACRKAMDHPEGEQSGETVDGASYTPHLLVMTDLSVCSKWEAK